MGEGFPVFSVDTTKGKIVDTNIKELGRKPRREDINTGRKGTYMSSLKRQIENGTTTVSTARVITGIIITASLGSLILGWILGKLF